MRGAHTYPAAPISYDNVTPPNLRLIDFCKQVTPSLASCLGLSEGLEVRIHFIIVMIRWTGLVPWEFEFLFPGSLTSTLQAGFPRAGELPGAERGAGGRDAPPQGPPGATPPHLSFFFFLLYYSRA